MLFTTGKAYLSRDHAFHFDKDSECGHLKLRMKFFFEKPMKIFGYKKTFF